MNDAAGTMKVYGVWDSGESLDRLEAESPGTILSRTDFRGETTAHVAVDRVCEALAFLKDDPACRFDLLTDVTAVHWPADPEPFEVVWLLYSVARGVRLRVSVRTGAEPCVPSVVAIWPGAGWLERECYDMFGVVFEGHPDLRRILLPQDYANFPLRKDVPLKS